MVGVEGVVRSIRGHVKSGRLPSAWLFSGESGAGKTSISRILALALQCKHQQEFGSPCADCRKKKSAFDIVEINASEISGVEALGQAVQGWDYSPKPPSLYRVYILDECHRVSEAAQNLLLKHFEDCPKSTMWIISTTEPKKILRTLRSRCVSYRLPGLDLLGVQTLVKRGLEKIQSDLDPVAIVDALQENGVTSPRFVLQALEKYVAGEDADLAAQIGSVTTVDTLPICRALVRGKWDDVRQAIANATPEDGRAIRASVCGYLKTMLVDQPAIGGRTGAIAQSILDLSRVGGWEDATQLAATLAALYTICGRFASLGRRRDDDDSRETTDEG